MREFPGTLMLSLAAGVCLSRPRPGEMLLERADRRFRIKLLDAGVEAALCRLADGPATPEELDKAAMTALPDADLSRLTHELRRLTGYSLIDYSCSTAGRELLRATATADLACFDFTAPPETARLRLSRFACLRRLGDEMVLDSPLSYARVALGAPALGGLLAALARPRDLAGVRRELPQQDPEELRACVAFLAGVGAVMTVDESGRTPEDVRSGPAQREFHDVMLHSLSRRGLTADPLGGTYRFRGAIPPAPAVKTRPGEQSVDLPRPDLDRLMTGDPPLAQVIERRRSVRRHADRPITIEQLGEFLFRVGRIKGVRDVDERAGRLYESTVRTYPSGGATYDLEIYVTAGACAGLGTGVYHYDPLGHRLTPISCRPRLTRRLLLDARQAIGGTAPPQILITLASRFARLGWKYQGIGYTLTLKNVGVLYEAMYLAATAMDLAPCALGCGDSALFSAVTGLDPLVESSVGEFVLGVPAAG